MFKTEAHSTDGWFCLVTTFDSLNNCGCQFDYVVGGAFLKVNQTLIIRQGADQW